MVHLFLFLLQVLELFSFGQDLLFLPLTLLILQLSFALPITFKLLVPIVPINLQFLSQIIFKFDLFGLLQTF